MNFNLRRPCPRCPFRKDCIEGWLGRARAEEIAEALVGEQPGTTFACHETTQHNDEGEYVLDAEEQHCVGAIVLVENEDAANQMLQVAERLELLDLSKIDPRARDLIFASRTDFEDHHSNERSP